MRKIVLFLAVFLIVIGGIIALSFVAPTLVQTYLITPFKSITSSISSGLSQLVQNPLAYAGSVVGSVAGTATLFSFAYKKAMQKKDEAQALLTNTQQAVTTNLTKVTAIKDEQIAKLTDEVTALKTTSVATLNGTIETMKTEHIKTVNSLEDQLRVLRSERDGLQRALAVAKEPTQIQVP